MAGTKLASFEYEIFGKVQEHSEDCEISGASGLGQEHRTKDGGGRGPGGGGKTGGDFTKKKAKSLGLVGWVRNTEQGTVTGIAQGPQDKVKVMKEWLEKEGSPESRVDRAEFKNERTISKLEFESFTVPDPDY
uniref:acylphosphatase n=1 Tax=Magallana gigas TaxID=29159 RepID=K1PP16_MAGGI